MGRREEMIKFSGGKVRRDLACGCSRGETCVSVCETFFNRNIASVTSEITEL